MQAEAAGALAAARVARTAGHLRVAMRALDEGWRAVEPGSPLARELGEEGLRLAGELIQREARVAALGELLRARGSGAPAEEALSGLLASYSRWGPRPGPIGVPKDGLKAGATGAFWVAPGARARILALAGGITGEGTEAFQRAIAASAEDVEWLLVDVAGLTYVGSTGLAQVVKVAERLAARGGGMSLFALSSSLQILVEMLGVERFLSPVAGLAEALACAQAGPRG